MTTTQNTEATNPCRHEESLYGRCTRCGMTWDEQARAAEQVLRDGQSRRYQALLEERDADA